LLVNIAVIMLPTVSDVLIHALDVKLADKIANFTATNLLVKDATDTMSKHTSLFPCIACEDWTFLDGVFYFKGHLYVLKPARQDLVCFLHHFPAGEHGGYFHTVHLV